jgi:hypothetical protein
MANNRYIVLLLAALPDQFVGHCIFSLIYEGKLFFVAKRTIIHGLC